MPKRILEGDVVSDKMDKTVTVLVERRYKHPMYKKIVKRTDKFAAHDETNAFKVGDRVQIEECKPISRRKTWTVITAPGKAKQGKTGTIAPEKEVQEIVEGKKADAPKKEEAKKAAPKKEAKKEDAPKKDEKAAEKKPAAKKAAPKKKTTSKKKDDK